MKDLTTSLHFASTDSTTTEEVQRLFERLLDTTWTINIYKHRNSRTFNLKELGWTIEYTKKKNSAGTCIRRRNRSTGEITNKRVALSMHFLSQSVNLGEGKGTEWEEVIRHELAHAVDIEMRGVSDHSTIWKAVAKEMLSNGERTFTEDNLKDEKPSKYTLKCVEEGCDYKRPSYKKRKENARSKPCCEPCYKEGKGYKHLVQIQNY